MLSTLSGVLRVLGRSRRIFHRVFIDSPVRHRRLNGNDSDADLIASYCDRNGAVVALPRTPLLSLQRTPIHNSWIPGSLQEGREEK